MLTYTPSLCLYLTDTTNTAYYLPDKSKEKNLFEWLQEELEATTEKLSGLLERPLTGSSAERTTMRDLTALAKRRLDHLLDGVHDGTISI